MLDKCECEDEEAFADGKPKKKRREEKYMNIIQHIFYGTTIQTTGKYGGLHWNIHVYMRGATCLLSSSNSTYSHCHLIENTREEKYRIASMEIDTLSFSFLSIYPYIEI